jgi:hypothetical protein
MNELILALVFLQDFWYDCDMREEKKSVYIESTIPSYATSRMSTDLIVAAHQALTKLFWEQERHKYTLFISQDVLDECAGGDSGAAARRLELIAGLPILPKTEVVEKLAVTYQKLLAIPDRAKADCAHLATCVNFKINYLLTWNCGHLGIETYAKVRNYNDQHGLWSPLLITPEYFFSNEEENQ